MILVLLSIAAASLAAMLAPLEVAAVFAVVPVAWAALVLVVRRLHDLDFSGLHALWIVASPSVASWTEGAVGTALSFAGHGVLAWLCLMPGPAGPNRFGAAPKPIPAPGNTGGAGDQGQNSSRG